MSKERAAQLVDAGLWLKLSGDLDGAKKLFERALKLDPENDRAKSLLEGSSDSQAGAALQPEVPASVPVANPFERNEALTMQGSAVDADWGMATGFESPTPFSSPSKIASASAAKPVAHAPPPVVDLEEHLPLSADEVFGDTDSFAMTPSSPGIAVARVPTPVPAAATKTPSSPGVMTVVIGGDPTPNRAITAEVPPRATPPQFEKSDPAPSAPLPALTPPQFESTPRNVVLTGTPAPQASPPSTPPLYSGPPVTESPNTIRLSGDPAPASPPRSTPPLYTGQAPPVASPPDVPQPVASPPSPPFVPPSSRSSPAPEAKSTDSAWNWSGTSAAPIQGVAAPWPKDAIPAASPGFAPHAQSAWDAKSNPGISLTSIVGEGRALELVRNDLPIGVPPVSSSPSSPGSRAGEVRALLRGARDLLDLDDHTGAVELILKAQAIAPEDKEVQALRERSEKTLLAMFESKLGKMTAIPRVLLKDDEIIWLNLDHRAGFVLAQIDGTVSFDDVFAVSGMSRLDTARIIAQLIDEGVISRG